jgi:hypothetical protein
VGRLGGGGRSAWYCGYKKVMKTLSSFCNYANMRINHNTTWETSDKDNREKASSFKEITMRE